MKPGENDEIGIVNILGVNIACVDLQAILDLVLKWCVHNSRRTIYYANAYCLNLAFSNSEYRDFLNQADLVYADGVSIVWSSRFLRGCPLQKMTGADWIAEFCELFRSTRLRIYILAGKPGIAELARGNLQKRFPGIDIVGAHNGYFIGKSEAEVLLDISQTQANVLFVGMGTPIQEKWIASHRNEITAPVCWGVGALFDYVAGAERRVPGWMYSMGLEWLWRFLIDPRGKWQRYIIGNPVFVYRVLCQKIFKKHFSSKRS